MNRVLSRLSTRVARHAKTFTLDFAWGEFVRLLWYKLAWRGKSLQKVDRFYPSSKTCSCCGFKHDALSLLEREWTCPLCATFHDRGIKSATNIRREGLRLLQKGGFTITNHRTAGTAGIHAREDRVRPATAQAPVNEPGIHAI